MTRIDFYSNASGRFETAVKLVAKALSQKLRIVIYAPDAAAHERIDKLLWITPPTGFVPHVRATDPLAAQTPVVIATHADEAQHPQDEVLLNLAREHPPHFARFERVVEIVGRDDAEQDKARARERYKFYKDRGYPLNHHDLAKAS